MTLDELRSWMLGDRCVYVIRRGEALSITAEEYALLSADDLCESTIRLDAGAAERLAQYQRARIEARS